MPPVRSLLWALLVFAVALPARALLSQEDSTRRTVSPEKAEAVRTLLKEMNTTELFILGFEEAISAQPVPPELPEGFWDAFKARVRSEAPQFLELMIPLYDTHLTVEEVNGLIEFYRTPLGRRFVAVQPNLTKEMMQLGQRWAMMLVGQVLVDLSKQPPQP